MQVSGITNRVAEILQDTANVSWTVAQLIEWVNDAIRALALVKPDSTAVTATQQLTASQTKQSLSGASDLRLIQLVRNMGANGTTIGRAIRLGDMNSLDSFDPNWHTATPDSVVREYMFNAERPDEFWVSPPVHATTPVYVELIKSVLPASVSAITDTLPVKDIYGPPLIEWCCYRAFSRDSERTPNWARAARHFQAFFNLLQVKIQADMAINPKVREKVQS